MADTPTPPPAVGPWTERITGRVKDLGYKGAAKQSLDEMGSAISKNAPLGRKAGFLRIGSVGVGATAVIDAVARSKSDGEDRSGWVRLVEGLAGAGMIAGGVLSGGRLR